MLLRPVRLKSSSIKSSVTSQKYSWPGKEQNQQIQVSVDVGVDDAEEPVIVERDGQQGRAVCNEARRWIRQYERLTHSNHPPAPRVPP